MANKKPACSHNTAGFLICNLFLNRNTMKKYTQEEFNAIPCNEYGVKILPIGDYAEIKSFGEVCRFGEWCRFGKVCRFGEGCRFGEKCRFENGKESKTGYPFIAFVGAGSRPGSKVYFFNTTKGIYIRCGCWSGFITAFRDRIKTTRADETYLLLCAIAEKKFA